MIQVNADQFFDQLADARHLVSYYPAERYNGSELVFVLASGIASGAIIAKITGYNSEVKQYYINKEYI